MKLDACHMYKCLATCLLAIKAIYRHIRRGTCLALRFQTGSWMLFIDSRNSNKMAAVTYTVHTSSIRIFICLYLRPYTFSASQIDCTPLDSQMRVCRHHTSTSPVFSIGSLSTGGRDRLTMLTTGTYDVQPISLQIILFCRRIVKYTMLNCEC